MEVSDKRVWNCAVCKMETTPRCPRCKVVVGQAEAEQGECNTCRTSLPETLADCPHCGTARSMYFSPSVAHPLGMRGALYTGARAARVLLGMLQVIGLILIVAGFSGRFSAPEGGLQPDALPIRWLGIMLFLAPIPLHFLLWYTAARLRKVPVQIGQASPGTGLF